MEIREILKRKPYYDWNDAIVAFEQYGNQKAFSRRLKAMGDTPYSRPVLEYQLRLLIGASVQMTDANTFACDIEGTVTQATTQQVITQATTQQVITQATTQQVITQQVAVQQPTEVTDAMDQRTKAYQQRAKLANSLHQFAVDDCDGRAAVMAQCEDWSKIIIDQNTFLTYWEQHNQLPPVEEAVAEKLPSDPVALIRVLTNTRTYLTKAQKKLQTLVTGSDDYNKTAKQIERYAQKIERAENALKTPT